MDEIIDFNLQMFDGAMDYIRLHTTFGRSATKMILRSASAKRNVQKYLAEHNPFGDGGAGVVKNMEQIIQWFNESNQAQLCNQGCGVVAITLPMVIFAIVMSIIIALGSLQLWDILFSVLSLCFALPVFLQ